MYDTHLRWAVAVRSWWMSAALLLAARKPAAAAAGVELCCCRWWLEVADDDGVLAAVGWLVTGDCEVAAPADDATLSGMW